jgi:hypothetical protein
MQNLIEENVIYDSVDKEIRQIEKEKIQFIQTQKKRIAELQGRL